MLKVLAIVAFALVSVAAIQSAQKDAPEKRVAAQGASSTRSQQTKAKSDNANTPAPVTVYVQAPATADEHESGAEQENLNIQRKLEWFTGGLVFVGFLQVATMCWQAELLRGTLRRIKEQAEYMDRQNKNAASAQRARIAVTILPDTVPITHTLWQVTFQVENIGRSHAFNVQLITNFDFTLTNDTAPMPEPAALEYNSAPVLKDGETGTFRTGPIWWSELGKRTIANWNEARMQGVADGKTFLHMIGGVSYEDIFGEVHVTPFRYSWNADVRDSWGLEPKPHWVVRSHPDDRKQT